MCGTTSSRRNNVLVDPRLSLIERYPMTGIPISKKLKSESKPQIQQKIMDADKRAIPAMKRKSFFTKKNNIRHIVVHKYHDHAADVSENQKTKKVKGGVSVPFPEKLHQMFDAVEKNNLQHIVSWQPHGRAFVVHKPKEFVKIILPTFFKQSKLGSFQRQLNLYGFNRITSGRDKGGYYHELFLRGKPFLTERMNRRKVKGTGVRGCNNPEDEPNFYRMPPVKNAGSISEFEEYERIFLSSFEDGEVEPELVEFEGKPFYFMQNIDDEDAYDHAMSFFFGTLPF